MHPPNWGQASLDDDAVKAHCFSRPDFRLRGNLFQPALAASCRVESRARCSIAAAILLMKSLPVWCWFGLALIAHAADVSPAATQREITELRREISRHDQLYHRHASPDISDSEYDRLKRRLADLESASPEAAKAAPPLAGIGD